MTELPYIRICTEKATRLITCVTLKNARGQRFARRPIRPVILPTKSGIGFLSSKYRNIFFCIFSKKNNIDVAVRRVNLSTGRNHRTTPNRVISWSAGQTNFQKNFELR